MISARATPALNPSSIFSDGDDPSDVDPNSELRRWRFFVDVGGRDFVGVCDGVANAVRYGEVAL